MPPQPIEVEKAVDGTQHVIDGNVIVQPKLIDKLSCLISRSPIIDGASRFTGAQVNQQRSAVTTDEFFNDICHKRTSESESN